MAKQNGFQNGMQGVFLTAAELTYRGFIVSLTARNAYGADLLVTDGQCKQTWSVQVKTNQSTAASFWLLSSKCESLVSDTHVYVFVALKGNQRPRFIAVPSRVVAKHIDKETTKSGAVFYSYWRGRVQYKEDGEGWEETFGSPVPGPSLSEASEPEQELSSTNEPTKESHAEASPLLKGEGHNATPLWCELPEDH